MVTVGAPAAWVLMTASSLTTALVLPAASVTLAVATKLVPLAGALKSTATLPALICAPVRVMDCGLLPVPVMSSTSPALALTGSVTSTLILPLVAVSSGWPMSLLSSASVLMTMSKLVKSSKLVVSTMAVSVLTGVLLPAASVRTAVAVMVLPSAGMVQPAPARLLVAVPTLIMACVRMTVSVTPATVKVTLSPTAALLPSKVALSVVVGPVFSAALLKPSWLASRAIVRPSSWLLLGAVVSSTVVSVATGVLRPRASVKVLVAVRVTPSSGKAQPVLVYLPALMSAAVSAWVLTVVPTVKVMT